MVNETLIRRGYAFVFAALAAFAGVEGAISTWLSVKYQRNRNYITPAVRDRTRLIAFTSWFTLIMAFMYMILFARSATSGNIVTSIASYTIFFGLIWILWTAGAASITASLGGGINCSKINYEVVYCNQLNALMGFAWAEWLVTTFALIVILILAVRSVNRGDGLRGKLPV